MLVSQEYGLYSPPLALCSDLQQGRGSRDALEVAHPIMRRQVLLTYLLLVQDHHATFISDSVIMIINIAQSKTGAAS